MGNYLWTSTSVNGLAGVRVSIYRSVKTFLERKGVGLYRRALSISAQGASSYEPKEERDAVSAEIERIAAENRIRMAPETLSYVPKRRGFLLPLAGNLFICACIAGALILFSSILNVQEKAVSSDARGVLGAENTLIAALKKQSAQDLRERDTVILDAQQKLTSLSAEAAQLREHGDSLVHARQEELQRAYDARLAEEKGRLALQGVEGAAAAARLQAAERDAHAAMDREMADYRRQVEAEQTSRLQEIKSLTAQYQDNMETARQDRLSLQADYARRESELQASSAERVETATAAAAQATTQAAQANVAAAKAAAETAKATEVAAQATTQAAQANVAAAKATEAAQRAGAELSLLQESGREERLAQVRITAGYDVVRKSLASSDFTGALAGLDSLKALLDDPALASLFAMRDRRPVDLFLIDSLKELVNNRQPSGELARLRAAEGNRAVLLARLKAIRARYAAGGNGAPAALDPSAMAGLLQAKLSVMEIIESDPVRTLHPGLAEGLDAYLHALEDQGRREGRSDAAEALNASFLELLGYTPPGSSADPLRETLSVIEILLSDTPGANSR